jgi:hypothetical protein
MTTETLQEVTAEGVIGFLIYNPFSKEYFFRVYNESDRTEFTDYRLAADEIEIEIKCKRLSLYHNDIGHLNKLDYTSKVLSQLSRR